MISVIIPIAPQRRVPTSLRQSLARQSTNIETIVVHGPNVQENCNRGAQRARGGALFFCDADVTLEPDCLTKLEVALVIHREAAYSYCDYNRTGRTDIPLVSKPFDPQRLKQSNYISTMALIRRADFPGFNPAVWRLQDWDLWLTMLEQGKTGVYVPEALFTTHCSVDGISGRGKADAIKAEAFVRSLHPNLYGR